MSTFESVDRLTRAQAAGYIGISMRSLDRLVASRLIEFIRLGPYRRSPIRFERAALDAYLEKRAVAPRVHNGIDRQRLLRLVHRAETAMSELRAALAAASGS